jgi:hypothetical protein
MRVGTTMTTMRKEGNGDDGIRSRGVEFKERQSKRKIHMEAHVGNERGGN